MKFSFLIYSYFPYGGQQRDFLRMANECLDRGHEVDVYSLRWQGEKPEGLNIISVPVTGLTRVSLYRKFTRWVASTLASQASHAVIGFNKMPLLDVYFAADPCFAEKAETQRGRYYKYTGRYKLFKHYEDSVFGANSKTQVMILSPQQRYAFLKHYPDCGERLHEVPPGISHDRKVSEIDQQQRRQFRDEIGIADDELLILQIGSGFKIKGVDRSLQAIASLPPAIAKRCRFILIGQDKPRKFLQLARKLGVSERISILPGRDDIPRIMAAADLLLHPAYVESAGYVLLEATIAGLPVLTTASCGYAFHIENANSGEVCSEPFRQEELNDRLLGMLRNLDTSPWSKNGIRYGQNEELYSLAAVAVDLIERFSKIKMVGIK